MAALIWGPRHATWLHTRFNVRATSRAAYHEVYATEWRGDLCTWVETVVFQESASYSGALVMGRRNKTTDARYRKGIWLGRSEESNEHIVCTADGRFQHEV